MFIDIITEVTYMLEIGSLVDGKYKILSVIGKGGMSVVYMAINEKANKTWAVKEIRKDGVLNFEAVKQGLVAETEMLKKLDHPNLPSIIDVIEDDETLIIVMDYIEGNSLNKTLDEYGAQPQEYVIEWAKQLCDVLGYLHSRVPPIIYRDLKPSNIMLKPDGNLSLIDFGTAREFKERNLEDTTCLGTIGYAAPEQFGGQGQTDARTDIYGLGATLHHLVTGSNPSEPPYEIRPIRDINPSLSSGLEQILIRCTQRNPDDRYQVAAELMYALEHYDEIDDKHKKKQKKKLGSFITVSILSILLLISGVTFNLYANKKASDTYQNKLYEASKTADYDARLKTYEECISIPNQAGQVEAYLGLIQTYKNNDSVFTVDEASQLERLITNNKEELKKDSNNYTEVCFEIGKLFWYYYEYGDGKDNQITRAKSSIEWFQDVIDNAPGDYENLGMAQVYANIGIFYRDIVTDVTEASDKGKYRPLYDNLSELINNIAKNENESEIVRLELLELSRSAIDQYATKFKSDGVGEDELVTMLNDIDKIVNSLDTTTDKTKEKKDSIINLVEKTRVAISRAYDTNIEVTDKDKGGM